MRNWRSNRVLFLAVCLLACAGLIVASQTGLINPVRDLLGAPLNFIAGLFNRGTIDTIQTLSADTDVASLQQRVTELETALNNYQSELVQLREVASDYQRMSELLNYTSQTQNREYIAADTISNADPNTPLRTIAINKGTRDGIAVGMPVVTQLGLVGRVLDVSANAARVLLITDTSSAISGRLQTTREEGSVIGQANGDLLMQFIPLTANVQEGDIVITSGLGGNLPADIVIGQVTSVRQREFELFQSAIVRSLNNFDILEIVLVVSNFQAADLSEFQQSDETTTGNGG